MEDFNLCKEVSPALVKDVDRSVKVTQLRRLNTAKNGAECQGDFALQAKATVCSTQLVMELSGKAMLLVQALPCPTWDTRRTPCMTLWTGARHIVNRQNWQMWASQFAGRWQ